MVCRCKTSWCDLNLTLDLSVMMLTYNVLSGLHFVYLVRTLVKGCICATSWCDLDLTFNLVYLMLFYVYEDN